MSNSIVARQPILNRKKETIAYELLFRSFNKQKEFDGSQATAEVITSSLNLIGLDNLTGSKHAFINFNAELIKSEIAELLPQKKIGIEILENIKVDQEFKSAYQMGYDYFQGYFFTKPDTISTRKIPSYKFNYLQVINKLNSIEPDLKEISKIIKELSLTDEIKKSILNQEGKMGEILKLIKGFERADWKEVQKLELKYNLDSKVIFDLYTEAIEDAAQTIENINH